MTQGDPIPPPPPDPYASPTGTPPFGTTPPGSPVAGAPLGTPPVPYESATGQIETNPEAKQWAMFAHISSLLGFVIPFGNFIGPLVIWLMKKDQLPFVNDQGKESMNFQITVLIAAIIAGATICIGIGFILLPLVGIAAAIMAILAGIKANEGVAYRYPFTLRLIK
jgi:uncharacterized Tic20 family protein